MCLCWCWAVAGFTLKMKQSEMSKTLQSVTHSRRFLFCTRLTSHEEDSSKSPMQLDVEDRWNPYRWSCNGQPQRRWSGRLCALHRTFHSHKVSCPSFLWQNWKTIKNALSFRKISDPIWNKTLSFLPDNHPQERNLKMYKILFPISPWLKNCFSTNSQTHAFPRVVLWDGIVIIIEQIEFSPERRVTPHLCLPLKPVSLSEHIHG